MRIPRFVVSKQLADESTGEFAERAMTYAGAAVALIIVVVMFYAVAVARGWMTGGF